MGHQDVIDPELLLRFAWRTASTLPEDSLVAPAPALALRGPDDQAEERHEVSATQCQNMARRVARIWAMTPRAKQAAATHAVLAIYSRSLAGFKGMAKHPLEAVRLFRLGVRHGRVLGEGARDVLWRMPLMVGEPEVVDLLVEIVEGAQSELAARIEQAKVLGEVARRFPALSGRLVHVFERTTSWEVWELAARWMVHVDRPGGVAALRRAARRPVLRVRARALDFLRTMEPSALIAEDVQWLLDDARRHPFPYGAPAHTRADGDAYETALLAAMKACPPPEGWRALEALLEGNRGEWRDFQRRHLDERWALGALAAGWPDRAALRIDRALAEPLTYRYLEAIEATGYLPDALARPRLLEGASLPGREVAERAKDLWFERFGEACPITPLSGVDVSLLEGPPTDALLARLMVLRGTSSEATRSVLDVALREAPSREALAVLLYSLRDFGEAHASRYPWPKENEWAEKLLSAFGEPAFAGMLALAARAARAGVELGWLGALGLLAHKGLLDETQRARLRELAASLPDASPYSDTSSVLEAVSAPPLLHERLWSTALRQPPSDPQPEEVRREEDLKVWNALAALPKSPEVEARFVREAEAAFERGAWELVGDLVRSCQRRGSEVLLDVASRALEAAKHDPGAPAAAEPCMNALMAARRLDVRWFLNVLERPASPVFGFAVAVIGKGWHPRVVKVLKRALDSLDRGGRSAAEAALALAGIEELDKEDRRLDGVLARAPERLRLELADTLLTSDVPLTRLGRHFAALLVSQDEELAFDALMALVNGVSYEGSWELLESVLPLGPPPKVRKHIESHMGEPDDEDVYWHELGEDDVAPECP